MNGCVLFIFSEKLNFNFMNTNFHGLTENCIFTRYVYLWIPCCSQYIYRPFNIFQVYQYFTIYRQYFLLKFEQFHEYLIQHSLKSEGTKDHYRQAKVPGTVPYWKANICWILNFKVWILSTKLSMNNNEFTVYLSISEFVSSYFFMI